RRPSLAIFLPKKSRERRYSAADLRSDSDSPRPNLELPGDAATAVSAEGTAGGGDMRRSCARSRNAPYIASAVSQGKGTPVCIAARRPSAGLAACPALT